MTGLKHLAACGVIRDMKTHRLIAVFAALSVLLAGPLLFLQPGFAQQRPWNFQFRNPDTESVLIILDASESMTLPAEGRSGESRMAAAKRVIIETLGKIPSNVNVGLRVYGDKRHPDRSVSCSATHTVVPIGANNRMQIASQMVGLKAQGMTPTSYALKRAIIEDFSQIQGKKSIILVSDGQETCAADPCDVAVEMVRNNVDVKINVIGYGLQDMDAVRQLKCVAMATKGKYISTDTSAQLTNAMGELFNIKKEVKAQIVTPASTQAPPQQQGGQNPPRQPEPVNIPELKAY